MYKIAIAGPESTGKSALSQELSAHYQTSYVPEMARKYLENLPRPYTRQDVETIARLQMEMEDKMAAFTPHILFCDTNLLVIKIWMVNAYGFCPDWILTELESRKYDLVLLTDIDLPWQPDPLREHPDKRPYFRDWYARELTEMGVRWSWVRGLGNQRLLSAIEAVEKATGAS